MSIKKKLYIFFLYTLCSIIAIISIYTLILNFHQFKGVNEKIKVSNLDNDYAKYKDNVTKLENYLSNYKGDKENKEYRILNETLNILKKDNVYALVPNSTLTIADIYELNNYFIENMYNKSWVVGLVNLNKSEVNQEFINTILNNANYIHSILLKNSNVYYSNDTKSLYNLVLKNYYDYSFVVLNICDNLGEQNEKNNE